MRIVELCQTRSEAEALEHLHGLEFVCARPQIVHIRACRTHPYGSVIASEHLHRQPYPVALLNGKLAVGIGAAQHLVVGGGNPHIAVGQGYYIGRPLVRLRHTGAETVGRYVFNALLGGVVDKYSVALGKRPKPVGTVGGNSHHRFVFQPRTKEVIIVESLLIMVMHGVSLILRAEPYITARVGEYGLDFECRHGKGEAVVVLMLESACGALV